MSNPSNDSFGIPGFGVGDSMRFIGGFAISREMYRGVGKYSDLRAESMSRLNLRRRDVARCCEFLLVNHWGLRPEVPNLEGADYWLSEGITLSLECFFGEFISELESNQCTLKTPDNPYLSWLESYRYGLLFALLANDEKTLRRLTEWVEPWLCDNETSFLLSRADNSYHKLLANFLTGRSKGNEVLASDVSNSRKKGPKLLLACLESIRAKDDSGATDAFRSHLKHYLKTDFCDPCFDMHFSFDGSLLWHVAKREGVTISGLSDEDMALIMTRESLGLDSGGVK